MWPSRQRNSVVRLFGKRVLLVVLLIVAAVLFSGVWKVARKERESAALRSQAEARLAELLERQTQLSAAISQLQTDRGKEEVLREQYGLAAEGEGVIIIVDPASEIAEIATTTKKTWFQTMFQWW